VAMMFCQLAKSQVTAGNHRWVSLL
jgi:hypothetical protein